MRLQTWNRLPARLWQDLMEEKQHKRDLEDQAAAAAAASNEGGVKSEQQKPRKRMKIPDVRDRPRQRYDVIVQDMTGTGTCQCINYVYEINQSIVSTILT
jgi:hypothetical protein